MASITPESGQKYILDACQKICNSVLVGETRTLRIIKGQEDYEFSDTSVPVTATGTIDCSGSAVTGVTSVGTGTIASSGTTITGTGTSFTTELALGKAIIVGTQIKEVTDIESDTSAVVETAFSSDLSASAFSISSTKFTREVVVGSSIISNSITKIVESITDAYNLVVTTPYSASQSAQTFTVDTAVTEIPTRFFQIYDIDRKESNFNRKVKVVDMDRLLGLRQRDMTMNVYTNYNTPFFAAVGRNANLRRFFRVYPVPDADKELTLYGYIRINPRNHTADSLSSYIPLGTEYDMAIKEYCKYRCYEKMKMPDLRLEALTNYTTAVRELKMTTSNNAARQIVSYR